jgi:hypothetical protein
VLIAEELPPQHFFGARVIGTLHEASVWLCGFTIGAAHRLGKIMPSLSDRELGLLLSEEPKYLVRNRGKISLLSELQE